MQLSFKIRPELVLKRGELFAGQAPQVSAPSGHLESPVEQGSLHCIGLTTGCCLCMPEHLDKRGREEKGGREGEGGVEGERERGREGGREWRGGREGERTGHITTTYVLTRNLIWIKKTSIADICHEL